MKCLLNHLQMQVTYCAAQGMTNDEIGEELHYSGRYIKNILSYCYDALSLERRDRTLLVATCFRLGYLKWVDDQMVVYGGHSEEDDRAWETEAHPSSVGGHDTGLPRSGTGERDRATA